MRVLTRLTAVVVTAGALIAPATMPAAHAATVVSSVAHVGAVTPGMFIPEQAPLNGEHALRPGSTLTIRNLYVGPSQFYTLTRGLDTVSTPTAIPTGGTGSVIVPPATSGSTYVLTSTSGATFTFVAL